MNNFRTIAEHAAAEGLAFLLAGGHAVAVHGFVRATIDLDLVIDREDQAQWRELLKALGYGILQDHPNFLQLTAPNDGSWPVDLILVDEATFVGLRRDAREYVYDGAACLVVSATHLIAMKLHALSQNFKTRELKDIADILELLRINAIDPDGPEFRRLCEKYATLEIYEQIRRRV